VARETIQTLITLVDADPDAAPERLKDIFTWRYERDLDRAKSYIGVAISLLAGLLISELKRELRAPPVLVALAAAGAVAVGIYGVWRYRGLDRRGSEYADMLLLLTALAAGR
jgi:hypothetical protein